MWWIRGSINWNVSCSTANEFYFCISIWDLISSICPNLWITKPETNLRANADICLSAFCDRTMHSNSFWDYQNLCSDTVSLVADLTGFAMATSNCLVQPTSSIPLDLITTASAEVDPKAQTPANTGAYSKLTWSPSCQKILEVYVKEHYKKVCPTTQNS